MFDERVGSFPDRVQNMYLSYSLLLKAVTLLEPTILNTKFDLDPIDDAETKVSRK